MGDKRQKNQLVLAFVEEDRGEAPKGLQEGTESSSGKGGTESPAIAEQLMEEVCERENCKRALKRVKANSSWLFCRLSPMSHAAYLPLPSTPCGDRLGLQRMRA